MRLGLRVDVCTYRGTRVGVPALVELLGRHGVQASFFCSLGPDNMGRHLWRLRKPEFLAKMLRTRPARLYGWDILLRGTLWPGPVIGRTLSAGIRAVADAGHEVGLHAWDHHAWQSRADALDPGFIQSELRQSFELLGEILGHAPTCTAAPGWRCDDQVLLAKERFPFQYNSDCRGARSFYPVVAGRSLSQPQIPVSLPTYDEVIGRNGIQDRNYNEWLLGQLREDRLNVLGVHAEVEGIFHREMFGAFLAQARQRGIELVPLGALLADRAPLGSGVIHQGHVPGREGVVACLA